MTLPRKLFGQNVVNQFLKSEYQTNFSERKTWAMQLAIHIHGHLLKYCHRGDFCI